MVSICTRYQNATVTTVKVHLITAGRLVFGPQWSVLIPDAAPVLVNSGPSSRSSGSTGMWARRWHIFVRYLGCWRDRICGTHCRSECLKPDSRVPGLTADNWLIDICLTTFLCISGWKIKITMIGQCYCCISLYNKLVCCTNIVFHIMV